MNPQIRSQYVDIPLTNYSIEKAPADLVSDILAPVLPVDKDTGIYFEYGQEDFDVSGSDVRAPGTEAGIEGYSLIQHTYGPLSDHSRKLKIPVEHERNQMAPLDAQRDGTRKLVRRAKLFKEADLYSKMSDTSVITQNSTPSNLWSDYTNSKLALDFKTAFDQLMSAIQKPRNQLSVVLSYPVWTIIINHPEVIERFKYSSAGIVTPDMFKEFLQCKEVIIAAAVKNTSAESVTPVTNSYIFGKDAWVMYREENPSLYTVSGLYTLNLPGINKGGNSVPLDGVPGGGPWTIYSSWSQKVKSTFIEISYYYQQFVMAPQAIYYFSGAVA